MPPMQEAEAPINTDIPVGPAPTETEETGEDTGDLLAETPGESTETPGETVAGEDQSAPEEPPYVVELRQQMAEMREKLEARGEPQKEEQPEPVKPPTPQEWPEIEKSWGFVRAKSDDGQESLAINPQQMIQAVTARLHQALQMAKDYTDKTIHGNVSDMRFDSSLTNISADAQFKDIRQYSQAIQEYLKKRYGPQHFGNPEFIKDGYFWAKGKNMKNVVKKVQAANERNKTIVKPATGGSRPAATKGRLSPQALTQDQRRIAKQMFSNMPEAKAFEEYARLY